MTGKIFMHCDRCSRTYTHVFTNCSQCGGPLRDFEVQEKDAAQPEATTASTVRIGLADLARYPFLTEAGEYMSKFDMSIFESPEMPWLIERAAARIKSAMKGEVNVNTLGNEDKDLLVFLSSVLIVRTIGHPKVTNKFAMFEAQRAETFLVRDLISGKRYFLLQKIFDEIAGVRLTYSAEQRVYKIKVPDYLLLAASIREESWKLVNRDVEAGYVLLDIEETVRLMREVIIKVLKSRLAGIHLKAVPEPIRVKVEELKQEFKAVFEYATVETVPGAFPPCVTKAIEMLNRGENLPNSGRFFLATYMLSRNRPVDPIVDLFRNAPDFNEKITRYHVETLAKKKRENGSCPGCQWVKANGACYPDAKCETISHPLQYDRVVRAA